MLPFKCGADGMEMARGLLCVHPRLQARRTALPAAVRASVSPPAAVPWPAGRGQAAGRRLFQAVVASSSTSESDSTGS
jgi:hypothetical protein